MSEIDPGALPAIDAFLQGIIDAGDLAGASWLAAQHGKVLRRSFLGLKDIASGDPLAEDTIFRIYSMTKPVTAVAMTILHERGLWSVDDPIARHLPELAGLKGPDGAPAAPTMLQLMTHTAGFGYGIGPGPHEPTDKAYVDAGVWEADGLADFVGRLAPIPLAYAPGATWRYSLSMDIQGAVIERLTGRTLPEFMREEIFAPLGMADTGFHVPAEKMPRLATLYHKYGTPSLAVFAMPGFVRPAGAVPKIAMGGGGLFSTLGDYARLGQMLLNGGELEGVRILKPESVALMTANHLPPHIIEAGIVAGAQRIGPGRGYAFNGAVFFDPAAAEVPVGRGTYQWDGASSVWFWIDPENGVLFVGLVQRMMQEGMPRLQEDTQRLIASALGRA